MQLEHAVIVAVVAVRVMQVAFDEVVDVVAVRHGLVPAARTVHVARLVRIARVPGRAARRIRSPDGDGVLADVVAVHVMEMAVVKVVDVSFVAHRGVAAAFAMDVVVIIVRVVPHPIAPSQLAFFDTVPARGAMLSAPLSERSIMSVSRQSQRRRIERMRQKQCCSATHCLGSTMSSLRHQHAALAVHTALFVLAGCARVHLGTHDAGHSAPTVCGDSVCAPGTVCCNESCGFCAPSGGCVLVGCTDNCDSNADCEPDEYCAAPNGACVPDGDGAGTCRPRPTTCDPVISALTCGCDGVTYASPCEAAMNGAAVRHAGACGPGGTPTRCAPQDAAGDGPCSAIVGVRWNGVACEELHGCRCAGTDCDMIFDDRSGCEAAYAECDTCSSNADCETGKYCHAPIGACGAVGECRFVPGERACPFGAPPVCGCDGGDYPCALVAYQVGVTVAHFGTCGSGCAPMDATGVGNCAQTLGVRWTGAECVSVNGCSCYGLDCERLFASVEECVAAFAHCAPPCGGITGRTCGPDEYCDFLGAQECGGTDAMGVCRPRPEWCEPASTPVCGCDGTVYESECSANAAGFDIWSDIDACERG